MGRGLGAIAAALVLWTSFAAGQDAPDIPLPPEAAWEQRITVQLERLEMELTALDKQKPTPPAELYRRVRADHDRLVELEKKMRLQPGVIKGQMDLSTVSADVASLHTRVQAVIAELKPKPAVPKPPKEQPAKPEAPKPEAAGRKWPSSLQFSATAKVVYQEVGEWFYSKFRRSGLGNDFLMTGYSGKVSFSISSQGLKEDVASADLWVVLAQPSPFAQDSPSYWTYPVTWSAEGARGVFGNESLKHYVRYADVDVRGPIAWIAKPKEVTQKLRVEVHVEAVRLKSGEEIRFDLPGGTKGD